MPYRYAPPGTSSTVTHSPIRGPAASAPLEGPIIDIETNRQEAPVRGSREEVQAAIDSLDITNARLSGPEELAVNETGVIELVLADEIADLESKYRENIPYVTESIKVSSRMEASLTSLDGIDIAPSGKVEQIVGTEATSWIWGIQSKKAGTFRLQAELWAIIDIDGEESQTRAKTFDYEVTVTITKGDQVGLFLKEHWKWGFTGLLIPIGKWAFLKRKPKSP